MEISELLELTIERNASDLHVVPGFFPSIRANGELISLKTLSILDAETSKNILLSLLTAEQKDKLATEKEIDFGYNFSDHRFRINLYLAKEGLAGAFRLITSKIRTLEELALPNLYYTFADLKQGLILLTGPTGEGKSTTLAAIINEVNIKYSKHILTIEDPIEYIYPKAKSIVSQRELGSDTHSLKNALKSALREDPDVVLIGEMRDYDTISSAITIAETGHLVFSTVHTNSAPETIDRIIDVFPPHQQNQVRSQLASSLHAVVSQRLIPNIDGTGRIPICETLINNPAVSALIREGKTHLIENVMQTSAKEGMLLLESYIADLYHKGKISKDLAYEYAIRPREIRKLIL